MRFLSLECCGSTQPSIQEVFVPHLKKEVGRKADLQFVVRQGNEGVLVLDGGLCRATALQVFSTERRSWLLVGLLLLAAIPGCGGESLSPAVLAARKALQFARPQEALDKLSEGSGDTSPAGHFFRACALEQLERLDAAKAEIKLALDAKPSNPKFKGYSLRLKLFEGDESAIEPLLELHEQNPSSAAVSLYSIFAFQAKHVRQRSEKKLRAARVQLDNAQTALKTALSLAGEIPEHHRELLGMAIWFEQPDDAIKLADAVLREEPENIEFLRERVKVLLLAKRPGEAISAGNSLYRRLERTEAAAVEFANMLNRLPPSPVAMSQYETLRESFPTNTAILLRHCWSLGKAGRSQAACEELAKGLDQQKDIRRRRTLAQAAIAIPLEVEDADVAAEQLKKYRNEIGDDQLVAFFEGQLAALRKDYAGSVSKMQDVVNIYRSDSNASAELARVALGHIQHALTEQQLADQVRKAAELTLRRSGIDQYDAVDIRKEAQSLLNLLEVHDRPITEKPKVEGEGPTVVLPRDNPPK